MKWIIPTIFLTSPCQTNTRTVRIIRALLLYLPDYRNLAFSFLCITYFKENCDLGYKYTFKIWLYAKQVRCPQSGGWTLQIQVRKYQYWWHIQWASYIHNYKLLYNNNEFNIIESLKGLKIQTTI